METRVWHGKTCAYKKWTAEEEQYLRDNYAALGSYACAENLGRARTAVTKKAQALGISGYSNAKYTYVDDDGYMMHRRDRKVSAQREHRIIMEKHLGRKLTANEVVHHIDGNKLNNDISNLQVMTRAQHINHHRKELQAAQGLRDSLG